MPPNSIPRKVEDIIFYYYAKLVIAPSSGFKNNYGFIIDKYKKLKSGEIHMSDYDRELRHIAEMKDVCGFCEKKCDNLKVTHIVPRDFGVPPGEHNMIYACEKCYKSKGENDLVYWWCNKLKKSKDDIPRVPIGLYLKIAYELHKINFSLQEDCEELTDLFKIFERKRRKS